MRIKQAAGKSLNGSRQPLAFGKENGVSKPFACKRIGSCLRTERSETSAENAVHVRDCRAVICDGDILVTGAFQAVFHFTFIQGTAAAVDDQAVSA